MDKRARCFGRRHLLFVVLASNLLLAASIVSGVEVVESAVNEADKQQVVRQVAQNWVEVGAIQYRRGFYKQAEKSFLRALEYQEYLTASEYAKLNKLLEKTRIAALGRKPVLERVQTAKELIERGYLIAARGCLEEIKDSETLTKAERKQVAESLSKLNNQINKQQKEIVGLYKRSAEYYRKGQFEKAREGFAKVARSGVSLAPPGKTAEDYLVLIDAILQSQAKPQTVQKSNMPSMMAVTEPVTKQERSSHTRELIDHRENIRRSYIRAVVKDVVTKAQDYVKDGKFYKAKEAVEIAEAAVKENREYLGDELSRQYESLLKQLVEKIAKGRKKWLGSL